MTCLTRIHALHAAAILAAIAPLASCTSAQPRAAAEPRPAQTITMGFHNFDPPSVTIAPGQTVEWQNSSFIWHTVTCDPSLAKRPQDVALPPAAQSFNSDKIDPGHRYSHVFVTPGTYRYFCIPHELNGMIGEIIVTPDAPAPAK